MNIGLYQSASSLSALERWQDAVAQNITSSQVTGYRKRTVNFSTQTAGELQSDPAAHASGRGAAAGRDARRVDVGGAAQDDLASDALARATVAR